ncbi:MAG: hypothetical protein GC168_14865 [Candidatus Hydrogenedens sp.]|nr:hypothetical protein [Candidatus Hydrogenedens sp.]
MAAAKKKAATARRMTIADHLRERSEEIEVAEVEVEIDEECSYDEPRSTGRRFRFGTVLGYAFGGVVAAVAAPVLAPVGVLTVGGALLGGGIGAAIGATKSRIDADHESDLSEDNEELQARLTAQEARFAESMKVVSERFSEHRAYEDFLIGIYAMAVALANCDGEIHHEERQDIQEFVSGISSVALPERLKLVLIDLFESPPTFNTAMLFVEKVDRQHWPLIGDMLRLIAESDGVVHDREVAFLATWSAYQN